MKLQFTEPDRYTIEEVADNFKVDADKLEKMYSQIQERNFYTDLWDIAMFNEEELKKGE